MTRAAVVEVVRVACMVALFAFPFVLIGAVCTHQIGEEMAAQFLVAWLVAQFISRPGARLSVWRLY
jgi:hypothetical protein